MLVIIGIIVISAAATFAFDSDGRGEFAEIARQLTQDIQYINCRGPREYPVKVCMIAAVLFAGVMLCEILLIKSAFRMLGRAIRVKKIISLLAANCQPAR